MFQQEAKTTLHAQDHCSEDYTAAMSDRYEDWIRELNQFYPDHQRFSGHTISARNLKIDKRLDEWHEFRGTTERRENSQRQQLQGKSSLGTSLSDDERTNLERRAIARRDSLLESHEKMKSLERKWRTCTLSSETSRTTFEEFFKPEALEPGLTHFPPPPLVPDLPSYMQTPTKSDVRETRRESTNFFKWKDQYAKMKSEDQQHPRVEWHRELSNFMSDLDQSEKVHKRYVTALELSPEGPLGHQDAKDRYRKCESSTMICTNGGNSVTQTTKGIVLEVGPEDHRFMRIGYNLHQLLKKVQLEDEETWVWADAVCIDQSSVRERGHQVKLMGDVYAQADKVVAWVSVRDDGAIAALNKPRLPSPTATEAHKLRIVLHVLYANYWKRKWIIQEVTLARTVTMLLDDKEFAMQDLAIVLENLKELQGHSLALDDLSVTKLAAYRRNRSLAAPVPKLLSDLVLAYEENQCSVYQDHVYALYNLVGEHRVHLEIDYTLQAHAWCEQVLSFMDLHEPSCRPTMLRVALSVARQAKQRDILCQPFSAAQLGIRAFDRGYLQKLEECAHSLFLCSRIESLHPGLRWTLKETNHCLHVHHRVDDDALHRISKRVLSYFTLSNEALRGLAAARIEDGDHVWQFLDTKYAFVVRSHRETGDSATYVKMIGRCYLFEYDPHLDPSDYDQRSHRLGERSDPSFAILKPESLGSDKPYLQSYDLRLNISDMYKIAFSADEQEPVESPPNRPPSSQPPSSLPVRPSGSSLQTMRKADLLTTLGNHGSKTVKKSQLQRVPIDRWYELEPESR
ncbi:hypothetical protein CBER1_11514 [Cercospora berteroae]|uniref:Heterokaryon incompatibility domain-containing protein n=1 Tax=Cercospora berteroae TaxID=357750 RepID=A0A2S6CK97_9PEZI|nr:hypothetical protein CBER1_11514 [Cercospora berteroae]